MVLPAVLVLSVVAVAATSALRPLEALAGRGGGAAGCPGGVAAVPGGLEALLVDTADLPAGAELLDERRLTLEQAGEGFLDPASATRLLAGSGFSGGLTRAWDVEGAIAAAEVYAFQTAAGACDYYGTQESVISRDLTFTPLELDVPGAYGWLQSAPDEVVLGAGVVAGNRVTTLIVYGDPSAFEEAVALLRALARAQADAG